MRQEQKDDLLESIDLDEELKFHYQCSNYFCSRTTDKVGLCKFKKQNHDPEQVEGYGFACEKFNEK